MNIIIFGATGNVGKQLVIQALASDHSVTAFSRSGKGLENLTNRNLTIIKGNVLNEHDVTNAISGNDAVICALGAGRKGEIRSKGTQNIIKAMEHTGIKRLIVQSSLGVGDSYKNLNFFWKHMMFGWFLKEAYNDHVEQEKYTMASNLDWIIVRPGAFTDGRATGIFKHGFSPEEKNISLKISKADIAMFILLQLESNQYLRKTPALSYSKS